MATRLLGSPSHLAPPFHYATRIKCVMFLIFFSFSPQVWKCVMVCIDVNVVGGLVLAIGRVGWEGGREERKRRKGGGEVWRAPATRPGWSGSGPGGVEKEGPSVREETGYYISFLNSLILAGLEYSGLTHSGLTLPVLAQQPIKFQVRLVVLNFFF